MSEDMREKFGVTAEQLDAWEADASCGIFQGEPRGEIAVGRPLMFGEKMRQVGFKEPAHKIEVMDRRARQLGLRRSDYLRRLVDEDLKAAGMA